MSICDYVTKEENRVFISSMMAAAASFGTVLAVNNISVYLFNNRELGAHAAIIGEVTGALTFAVSYLSLSYVTRQPIEETYKNLGIYMAAIGVMELSSLIISAPSIGYLINGNFSHIPHYFQEPNIATSIVKVPLFFGKLGILYLTGKSDKKKIGEAVVRNVKNLFRI
jgi:hypothetical protein